MAKLDLNVVAKDTPDQSYQIVEFRGEMDKSNISDVRDVLVKFMDSFADSALIFDLTYFNFINSEGVGLMVSFYYKMKKAEKTLFFVNPQPQVADVFDLIGLTKVVEPVASVEQALQKIN
jgi:anti-anti-sigma factor